MAAMAAASVAATDSRAGMQGHSVEVMDFTAVAADSRAEVHTVSMVEAVAMVAAATGTTGAMVTTTDIAVIMDMVTMVIVGTTATMAAGILGTGAVVGATRGTMTMDIPITDIPIMIRTTTDTLITDTRILAIRITVDMVATPATATPVILITDTGMELATGEAMAHIAAGTITTTVEFIMADSVICSMAAQ